VKASSDFEGIHLADMGRDGVVGSARLATGWTVQGSNAGGGETFRTCPDRPRGLLSLLYNGYQDSFPGVKGYGVDQPPL
jgi:hypothetical protein